MGTVISFPVGRTARASRVIATKASSATVIILPVIRIERYTDAPRGYAPIEASTQRRRRRRRSSRA